MCFEVWLGSDGDVRVEERVETSSSLKARRFKGGEILLAHASIPRDTAHVLRHLVSLMVATRQFTSANASGSETAAAAAAVDIARLEPCKIAAMALHVR